MINSVLAFDLDGTLVPRNHHEIHPLGLVELLNFLNSLGHISIPVTGKPAKYASKIFPINNLEDHGVIAENAGVFKKPNSDEVLVYGPSLDEVRKLRVLLGIGMDKVNVTDIKIFDKTYQVSIDPDDVSILTIFTDPSFVSHRWTFRHDIQALELVEKLKIILEENEWTNNLEVLPPFPDGGVQVIRKDPTTGKSIDKSSIVNNLKSMYPDVGNIPIAMFGDGHNDIPAMRPNEVIPLTFSNAHDEVVQFVRHKNGYISKSDAPEGNGIPEDLLWLANKGFFGKDKTQVIQKIESLFKIN